MPYIIFNTTKQNRGLQRYMAPILCLMNIYENMNKAILNYIKKQGFN